MMRRGTLDWLVRLYLALQREKISLGWKEVIFSNHRTEVLSQREGWGKPTQSPWVYVAAESHRLQLRNIATGNSLCDPYHSLWLKSNLKKKKSHHLLADLCQQETSFLKISAQWIERWQSNSTESFLLGNLKEKDKEKKAIKEQRQRSRLMSRVMTRTEAASGKMTKWPVTKGASGWLICSFNKHLPSSHFV